jgi:O-antigen/teichoic acid export membrane protein
MIKKILTYSFGELLVKGTSFLAVLFYSRLILPHEYGTLGFLNALVSFLPFILTFYYIYAYVRFSVEVKEKRLISTYFFMGIILNIFYFLSAILLYFLFIQRYNIELRYFLLSISSSSMIFLFQILQMYYRSKGFANIYIKFSIFYSLLGLALNFSFLFYFDDNIFAMLFSSAITSLAVSIIAYQILSKFIYWKLVDVHLIKRILKYTIPLVPGAIALLIFSQSDKIVLINYISRDELGVYTLAFTLGLSMSYIGSAFFMSYQPLFYEKLSLNLEIDVIRDFWKHIVFILSALLLSFIIILIAYQYVDSKYKEGVVYALTVALAYNFITFSQMMELHLTYIKQTLLVSIVYGVGGIITIALLVTLTPLYGAEGASLSLLISAVIISILMYFFAQKKMYLDYNKGTLVVYYIVTLCIGLIVVWM